MQNIGRGDLKNQKHKIYQNQVKFKLISTDKVSEPLSELGILLVDLTHRLGVELERSDLLLALVSPELVLPLEPLSLSVELFKAQSVVLLLLLFYQPIDGILGHIAGGVLRIVVVSCRQMPWVALIDLVREVEGAVGASGSTFEKEQVVEVLDLGELAVG